MFCPQLCQKEWASKTTNKQKVTFFLYAKHWERRPGKLQTSSLPTRNVAQRLLRRNEGNLKMQEITAFGL